VGHGVVKSGHDRSAGSRLQSAAKRHLHNT